MISATDPATVSNIVNGGRSPQRVVSILEGESLINDATTITLFVMISSLLTVPGYDLNWIEIAGRFALVLTGSLTVVE